MTTILAAIDFSAVSKAVVAEAETLARGSGGRIALLHVADPPTSVVDYGIVTLNIPKLTAASERVASRRLAEWKTRIEAKQLKAVAILSSGTPVQEILRQARTLRAKTIVIGSHGRSGLLEVLVGSTATGVLKRAACPVLVIPAKKKRGK